MKKKIGELTFNEIAKICKTSRKNLFSCSSCPLYKDYECMATIDLQQYTDKEFEKEFPKILEQEIEVEQTLQHKSLAESCWKIVKAKRVSIVYLEDSQDVEQYNEFAFQTNGYASQLTKAEFETLKEGLK